MDRILISTFIGLQLILVCVPQLIGVVLFLLMSHVLVALILTDYKNTVGATDFFLKIFLVYMCL